MYGKNPHNNQKEFHDGLCSMVGCVVCRLFHSHSNNYCSVHHIDGRTKSWAHWFVIPLCAGHHQAGSNTDFPEMLAVHGSGKAFAETYDTEENLFAAQFVILQSIPDDLISYVNSGGDKMPMGFVNSVLGAQTALMEIASP